MRKLYHGSIFDFDRIDLSKGRGYKDFGRGFYATAYPDHAELNHHPEEILKV